MDDGPRLKLSQVWPRFLRRVRHRQRRKHFVDKNTDHPSGIQISLSRYRYWFVSNNTTNVMLSCVINTFTCSQKGNLHSVSS